MVERQRRFPLVADDEPIMGSIPQMNLYEESDLISNIRGNYQDKEVYTSLASIERAPQEQELDHRPLVFEKASPTYSRKDRIRTPQIAKNTKTQGQLAREQAKEDLKKKRAATYLRDETPAPSKRLKEKPILASAVSTEKQPKSSQSSHLSHLADRLQQTSYIIADMPAVYSLDKESREKTKASKRNSYDFLKKSQIYNYPERQLQKEYQLAQELNLTHIEKEIP